MRFIILILFLSLKVIGDDSLQPEKQSVDDIRNRVVIFTITNMKNEEGFLLERSSSYDYTLRKIGEDDDMALKISSVDAKKLDLEFSRSFIKLMYEFSPSQKGCKVTLRLNMKGEIMDICDKDDKKTQEIDPFLKNLAQRF